MTIWSSFSRSCLPFEIPLPEVVQWGCVLVLCWTLKEKHGEWNVQQRLELHFSLNPYHKEMRLHSNYLTIFFFISGVGMRLLSWMKRIIMFHFQTIKLRAEVFLLSLKPMRWTLSTCATHLGFWAPLDKNLFKLKSKPVILTHVWLTILKGLITLPWDP